MRYGVKIQGVLEQWQKQILEKGERHRRYIDVELEKEFWKQWDPKSLQRDPYAETLSKVITEIIQQTAPKTLIELGSGWGNYTFDLAKIVPQLLAVDLSKENIQFLKQKAEEENIGNIQFQEADFEYEKLPKADVIFAYNCFYRIIDILPFLKKLNDTADKLVLIGMNTGYEPTFNLEFEKERIPVSFMGNDYISLTNFLYMLGIDVNQKMVPLKRLYRFKSLEELQNHEICRAVRPYDDNKVKAVLKKAVSKSNGFYEIEVLFYGALIYWEPRKIILTV